MKKDTQKMYIKTAYVQVDYEKTTVNARIQYS